MPSDAHTACLATNEYGLPTVALAITADQIGRYNELAGQRGRIWRRMEAFA